MSTYTPLHCDCIHHNALTCIAEQNNMSRFNAKLVFATSTGSGEPNGCCACRCHVDRQEHPISEEAWRRARLLRMPERRAPRRKNQDTYVEFVAPPAPEKRGGSPRKRGKNGKWVKAS